MELEMNEERKDFTATQGQDLMVLDEPVASLLRVTRRLTAMHEMRCDVR